MTLLLWALAGVASWSFLEYAIHNWGGHLAKGRTPFSREHLKHHAKKDYFTGWKKKIVMAMPTVVLATTGSILLLGVLTGLVFATAFLGTYLTYEILHRRLHTHAPRGRYGRWARKHHFAHHFTCPKHNHGVTSPIWDIVFGTWQPVDQVRVPLKHRMDWLVDPATDDVKPEYARDYVVVGRRRNSTAPRPGVLDSMIA